MSVPVMRFWWKLRKMLPEAHAWRNQKIGELKARIRINEAILHSLRTELAELRALDEEALAYRYGWETQTEIAATLKPQREFVEAIGQMFAEGRPRGMAARAG